MKNEVFASLNIRDFRKVPREKLKCTWFIAFNALIALIAFHLPGTLYWNFSETFVSFT